MSTKKFLDLNKYFYDLPLESPGQGQTWEEANRVFAKKLIDRARQASLSDDGSTTYIEDVIGFFSGGIKGKLFQNYVRYALNSLYRGAKLARDYMEDTRVINRYLDVGCAYGGCPVAMAEAHVGECVGIEFDARLLLLAKKLAAERHLSHRVTFYNCDITKYDEAYTLGSFDLITCIDVLEHVLDPEAAITSLVKLMGENSVLKVDVPNMYSFQLINCDPHHHLFGNTLLSRNDAMKVFENEFPGNKRYTVGYLYPLEWYLDKFKKKGVSVEVMDKVVSDEAGVLRTQSEMFRLSDALMEKVRAENWPNWRKDLIANAVRKVISQVKMDASGLASGNLTSVQFQLRYSVPVYHLKCIKAPLA
jgi:2-polyprenyl-3-methyl-5-hydroxy-6-metoxy-1,4-benzoquinol methylase